MSGKLIVKSSAWGFGYGLIFVVICLALSGGFNSKLPEYQGLVAILNFLLSILGSIVFGLVFLFVGIVVSVIKLQVSPLNYALIGVAVFVILSAITLELFGYSGDVIVYVSTLIIPVVIIGVLVASTLNGQFASWFN